MNIDHPTIQEKEYRQTSFGLVQYIRVSTPNYRQLSWSEVHNAFVNAYPDKWAVQCFPPLENTIDEENIYHLFVCDEPPIGLDIRK